jgi:hypothetical protein
MPVKRVLFFRLRFKHPDSRRRFYWGNPSISSLGFLPSKLSNVARTIAIPDMGSPAGVMAL